MSTANSRTIHQERWLYPEHSKAGLSILPRGPDAIKLQLQTLEYKVKLQILNVLLGKGKLLSLQPMGSRQLYTIKLRNNTQMGFWRDGVINNVSTVNVEKSGLISTEKQQEPDLQQGRQWANSK